jgi:Fe-S cluster assembly protein SufD
MNLLSTYDRFKQVYPAAAGLAISRETAFAFAAKNGLPTKQNEDWHYTSVKVLADVRFMPSAFNPVSASASTLGSIQAKLNNEFCNLIFFNGVYEPRLSDQLPSGVFLEDAVLFPRNFDDTFDALNCAYQVKPYLLKVPTEASVDKPVNFLFFSSVEGGPALMSHPRIQIEVGNRSSISIIESFYGASGVSYFVNSIMDLQVGESARVTYVRAQCESDNGINIGRSRIQVGQNANLEFLSFSTGAGLSRHSLSVNLNGPGSNSEILGVYKVSAKQHLDNTTSINHFVGHCSSNQLYKGILDDESRSVFSGKVFIQKNAQKASSAQLNKNLLLSSKAEADSKPNLEIYADDVKASHGSTVGQLNREEVFYMQSRAISKEKAIAMLSKGFLTEVVYKVTNDKVRSWLLRELEQVFEGPKKGGN